MKVVYSVEGLGGNWGFSYTFDSPFPLGSSLRNMAEEFLNLEEPVSEGKQVAARATISWLE